MNNYYSDLSLKISEKEQEKRKRQREHETSAWIYKIKKLTVEHIHYILHFRKYQICSTLMSYAVHLFKCGYKKIIIAHS